MEPTFLEPMGFDTELFTIGEPPQAMQCNIFLGVFDEPVSACKEEHMFCLGCLSGVRNVADAKGCKRLCPLKCSKLRQSSRLARAVAD